MHASWYPQFTFWGEYLDARTSDPPWRVLRNTMMNGWMPFSERNASLFYSGAPNTNPLRGIASKCPYENFLVNRPGLKVYGDQKCRFKYLLYVDGTYASGSILPIVGCGSVPFLVKSPWTTAWSRCLVPYKHFIPITSNPKMLCADLKSKVSILRHFIEHTCTTLTPKLHPYYPPPPPPRPPAYRSRWSPASLRRLIYWKRIPACHPLQSLWGALT